MSGIDSFVPQTIWEPADQAALLALSAYSGDIAVQQDNGRSYILAAGGDPAQFGDWVQIGIKGSVENKVRAFLADQEIWEISHTVDSLFNRTVQVYHDTTVDDISLDMDDADFSLFTKEDSGKTEFLGGQAQLKLQFPLPYGQWKLDELSGVNAPDNSGKGNNGTLINMEDVDWIPGKLGNCLSFDGVNEYVDIGSGVASFERTQAFSVEAFVRTTNTGSNGMAVVSKQLVSGDKRGWSLRFRPGFSDWVCILANNQPGGNRIIKRYNAVVGVNDGAWHQVIMTYDGSSTAAGVNLYVDGLLQTTKSTVDNLSATIVSTATLSIASRNGSGAYWDGQIDNVIIYDEELSLPQITERYNAGAGLADVLSYDTSGQYIHTNINQIVSNIWDALNSITVAQTTPASTDVKYMLSVDGRTTWHYWNGSTWAEGVLGVDGNTKAEIEALTKTEFDLLFVAGTLDVAFTLETSDPLKTPQLDGLTINHGVIGSRKLRENQIDIFTVNATTTQIKNISGVQLNDLRAVMHI